MGVRRRRALRPAPPVRAAGGAAGPPPVDDTARAVDAVWVTQLLATLPPRQREAVVLRHLADLRLADIARAQGVTTGTVKASLHAAYRHLRVEVGRDEEVTLDASRGT